MSFVQAEKPIVGEVPIAPTLMVRSTPAPLPARALTQNAAQPAAEPAIDGRENGPVTMAKVCKPALQRRVERVGDHRQALAVGTSCFRADAVSELVQTLLAWQPQGAAKGVAQKVEAIRPCVHDLRLGW